MPNLAAISRQKSKEKRERKKNSVPKFADINPADLYGYSILLDYQKPWLLDERDVTVDEKSRQIGWSWTMALRAVYRGVFKQKNAIYSCYNKEGAKQFIKDVAFWVTKINVFVKIAIDEKIVNQSDIKVFEVVLENGCSITATAGNPEQLRGKPGYDIYIDEAAYREYSIDEILAAANACLLHGGTIRIGSTHCGVDSDFHNLVKKVTSDPSSKDHLDYGHSKVTFKDAVRDGLYKRICIKNGEVWTKEKEDAWVAKIYSLFPRSGEELDVEPSDYKGGNKVIKREHIKFAPYQINENTILFRYYDLAASISEDAYYSADVLIAFDTISRIYFVIDWFADKIDPTDAETHIQTTIQSDPLNTIHIIEVEPGSSGIKYVTHLQQLMQGYNVFPYQPKSAKLYRALPVGKLFEIKKMYMEVSLGERGEQLANIISQFDGTKKPLVNDLTDCFSGIVDFVTHGDILTSYLGGFNVSADEYEEELDDLNLEILSVFS